MDTDFSLLCSLALHKEHQRARAIGVDEGALPQIAGGLSVNRRLGLAASAPLPHGKADILDGGGLGGL